MASIIVVSFNLVSAPSAPVDTYSDFVTGVAPAALLSSTFTRANLSEDNSTQLRMPYIELYAALLDLDKSLPKQAFSDYLYVRIFATDFRAPQGFGSFQSSKCFVLSRPPDKTGQTVGTLLHHADQVAINGRPSWRWKLGPYEGHPSNTVFFATETDVGLLICNDELLFRKGVQRQLDSYLSKPAVSNQFEVCRESIDASEHTDDWVKQGIVRFCLTSDDTGKRSSVIISSSAKDGSAAFRVASVLKLTSSSTQISKLSWRWDIPQSDQFASALWFGIIDQLGFGVVV